MLLKLLPAPFNSILMIGIRLNHLQNLKNHRVCICVTILYWALNCRTKVNFELRLPKKPLSIWMQLWRLAPIPHRRTLVSLICSTLCTSTSTASTGHLTELVVGDIAAVAVGHPEWLEDVPAYICWISVVASKTVEPWQTANRQTL
jgi:ABC-type nitrate/sulfonate/bicarbonate transport system permease component